jgi:hypothetical protein
MTWNIVRWAARILLAAAAMAAWQPAFGQREIESDGPYLHAGARAVFPLSVGEFRRSDIYQYDDEGLDVSASYNLMTPQGRLLITAYIYPATPGAAAERTRLCDAEFGATKMAISSQHDNAVPVEEGRALAIPGTDPTLAHRAVYRFSGPFDDHVQPIRSEAHLYCYVGGDWLVKYRASAPAAVETRARVEAFIRAGPWPGRSAERIAWLEEPAMGRSVEAPKQSGEPK